jgi:CDP-diacylglycerol--glycerol-3-phosphate 3-phosphatidyltransferase
MTTADHGRSTFGPSALMTPANVLTMARLLATPVLVAMVVVTNRPSWLLASIWLVCAGSDGVDGFVARRQGTTRSGAFLDPLADKFLVLGVMAALAWIHEISWIPVALIGVREVAMSVFRIYAGQRSVSIPARQTAKLKTFLQDVVVGLALLPPVGLHHLLVVRSLLWAAAAATLYTGLEYLFDGRRLLAGAAATGGAAGAGPGTAGAA